jgi:hypothetical protein
MAMPKVPSKRAARTAAGAAEYRFRIDAYSPETMPMARLADYMAELARLLGEPAAVHFKRLARGSTVLVHSVDREAVPKVRHRAVSVRRGDGPQEAVRAFRTINKLLREDNAVGWLREKRTTAVVLKFPGRLVPEEKFTAVRQYGSIDGIINRIGGKDDTIHVTLEMERRQVSGCYTTRAVAKELRHVLFEPVRLRGRGKWSRDGDGNWSLDDFKIESFEALSDAPLSQVLTELRSIPTEWTDESYDELGGIRHGPGDKRNGGH